MGGIRSPLHSRARAFRPSCPRGLHARAQSLVVWAINEGREAADKVHNFLRTK